MPPFRAAAAGPRRGSPGRCRRSRGLPLGHLAKRDHRIVTHQHHGLIPPPGDVRPLVQEGSVTVVLATDAKTGDPHPAGAEHLTGGRGEPDVLRPDPSHRPRHSVHPLVTVVVARHGPHRPPESTPRRQPQPRPERLGVAGPREVPEQRQPVGTLPDAPLERPPVAHHSVVHRELGGYGWKTEHGGETRASGTEMRVRHNAHSQTVLTSQSYYTQSYYVHYSVLARLYIRSAPPGGFIVRLLPLTCYNLIQ